MQSGSLGLTREGEGEDEIELEGEGEGDIRVSSSFSSLGRTEARRRFGFRRC